MICALLEPVVSVGTKADSFFLSSPQLLLSSYPVICALLEPVVSVGTKADVATTLVRLTQHSKQAKDLVTDIVANEIKKNGEFLNVFQFNIIIFKITI